MSSPPPAPAAPKPPHDKLSAPARALRKLGLARDIDLALHLPMRYVDETCLTPIRPAAPQIAIRVMATYPFFLRLLKLKRASLSNGTQV